MNEWMNGWMDGWMDGWCMLVICIDAQEQAEAQQRPMTASPTVARRRMLEKAKQARLQRHKVTRPGQRRTKHPRGKSAGYMRRDPMIGQFINFVWLDDDTYMMLFLSTPTCHKLTPRHATPRHATPRHTGQFAC